MLAHVVQREQAFFFDRFDDRAFAHAVAAADFHVIRHCGGLVLALMSGVTEVGFAEHQLVADVADLAAFAQQLEVIGAVDGVAVEHAADQFVILDHQTFVNAADRVG